MALTKDDAAKLALSGYSKDDIIALGFDFKYADTDSVKVSDKSDSNEKAAPEENNNESNKKDTMNESNKTDTSNAAIEALTKTVGELSATVKALQEANVKGARDDSNPKGNNGQSATDVVKNFIKSM